MTNKELDLSDYGKRMNYRFTCDQCGTQLEGTRFFHQLFNNEADNIVVQATNASCLQMLAIEIRHHLTWEHNVKFPK